MHLGIALALFGSGLMFMTFYALSPGDRRSMV